MDGAVSYDVLTETSGAMDFDPLEDSIEEEEDVPILFPDFHTIKTAEIRKQKLGMIVSVDLEHYQVEIMKTTSILNLSWLRNCCISAYRGHTERKEKEMKNLLKDIRANFEPGKLCAVMGPSGGGKTSLLNLIAGRTHVGSMEGDILFNGQPRNPTTRRQIGYVLQDDLFFVNLTVRETLTFVATVKLSSTLGSKQTKKIVSDLITKLKLENCENTIVGNQHQGIKGISGGEKRRLSIGCELLGNPSLLILDEPTSGLDSLTAYSVVSLLKNIAKEGKTVLCSIHQPSSQVMQLFNNLLLLSEGKIVYFGEYKNATPYFASLGYNLPYGYNPTDYFLELLSSKHKDGSGNYSCQKLQDAWLDAHPRTPFYLDENLDELNTKTLPDSEDVAYDGKTQKYPTSWLVQFGALCKRSFQQKRGSLFNGYALFKMFFISFLVGLLWLQVGYLETAIADRLGMIFFTVVISTIWPLLDAVFLFPAEKAIVELDRASGRYRLSAYYLAKLTVETTMDIYLPLIYDIIAYWMVGLNPQFVRFFLFSFIVELNYFLVQSIGYFFSALFMNGKEAQVAGLIFVLFCMLAGGFYRNLENLPSWMRWAQYVSFMRYTYNGLVVNDVGNLQFECVPGMGTEFSRNGQVCPITADSILQASGLSPKLGPGPCIGIILAFTLLFRFLGYLSLRIFHKSYKKTI